MLTNTKELDKNDILEILKQDYKNLDADKVEIPKQYLINLITLAQQNQALQIDTELNKIVDVCMNTVSNRGCIGSDGYLVNKATCPKMCPLNNK